MPPAGRIPRAIVEFFNAPGGHSLIAKGPAGTGKTTFALQLTEELGEVTASHYLSSRVSDESLFRQFVWLKERLKPAGLQTGLKVRLGSKVARNALDQLEGKLMEGKEGDDEEPEAIGSGEVKGNFLEVTLGFDLPELEAAYEFVDGRLPERSLILIDSIDALGEHYGISAAIDHGPAEGHGRREQAERPVRPREQRRDAAGLSRRRRREPRVVGVPRAPAPGADDRKAAGAAGPAPPIPVHARRRAIDRLRHPRGHPAREAAAVEAGEGPLEGRREYGPRAARPDRRR